MRFLEIYNVAINQILWDWKHQRKEGSRRVDFPWSHRSAVEWRALFSFSASFSCLCEFSLISLHNIRVNYYGGGGGNAADFEDLWLEHLLRLSHSCNDCAHVNLIRRSIPLFDSDMSFIVRFDTEIQKNTLKSSAHIYRICRNKRPGCLILEATRKFPTPIGFMYFPSLKNHPSEPIGFVYSPLWKITHQKAIDFVYSPLWIIIISGGRLFRFIFIRVWIRVQNDT